MKRSELVIALLIFLIYLPAHSAEPLTGEAFVQADNAYKALADGDIDNAEKSVKSALQILPDHPQLLGLLAYIQSLLDQNDSAIANLDRAIFLEPDNARMLAQRGYLQIKLDKIDAAIADFQNALQLNQLAPDEERNVAMALAELYAGSKDYHNAVATIAPFVTDEDIQITARWQSYLIYTGELPPDNTLINDPVINFALVDKAYEALRNEDNTRSLELFQLAERYGGLTALQFGDAAYVAKRLFYNEEADRLFRNAIDANQAETDPQKTYAPGDLFGLRRTLDDINRHWGFVFSNSISPAGLTGRGTIGLPSSSSGNTSGDINQIGSEIYYQPPVIGYRDGRQLQFFARSFQTMDDQTGGAEGFDTNQGSAGVRWKPFRDYNLVLTTERLFSVGEFADDDWLLRVGFSLDEGVDIKPYLSHWPYRSLFAEAAYFVDQDRNIDTIEARWGHTFRLPQPGNITLTPHLVFAFDVDTAADQETSAGIGVGISSRIWFRESTYRAPASYVDLTAQYREGLIDDTVRQDGTFLRFILWY